jgi:hypothetical protein
VAAGLLAWQSVQETVSITWTGDNPQTLIFTHLYITTWGIVAAALAVTLLPAGHLLARHRARLI